MLMVIAEHADLGVFTVERRRGLGELDARRIARNTSALLRDFGGCTSQPHLAIDWDAPLEAPHADHEHRGRRQAQTPRRHGQ